MPWVGESRDIPDLIEDGDGEDFSDAGDGDEAVVFGPFLCDGEDLSFEFLELGGIELNTLELLVSVELGKGMREPPVEFFLGQELDVVSAVFEDTVS